MAKRLQTENLEQKTLQRRPALPLITTTRPPAHPKTTKGDILAGEFGRGFRERENSGGGFALCFGESGWGNSEGNSEGIQGEFALGFGEFAPATACETPLPAVRGLLMSCTESSLYNIRGEHRHLHASNGASHTRSGSSARLPFDAF